MKKTLFFSLWSSSRNDTGTLLGSEKKLVCLFPIFWRLFKKNWKWRYLHIFKKIIYKVPLVFKKWKHCRVSCVAGWFLCGIELLKNILDQYQCVGFLKMQKSTRSLHPNIQYSTVAQWYPTKLPLRRVTVFKSQTSARSWEYTRKTSILKLYFLILLCPVFMFRIEDSGRYFCLVNNKESSQDVVSLKILGKLTSLNTFDLGSGGLRGPQRL